MFIQCFFSEFAENFSVHQEITSKLTRLQSQLNSFIRKCPEQLEKFLVEHSKHIHNDHLLMVEVKYMLSMMYGNVVGYQFKGLTFSLFNMQCNTFFDFFRASSPTPATEN